MINKNNYRIKIIQYLIISKFFFYYEINLICYLNSNHFNIDILNLLSTLKSILFEKFIPKPDFWNEFYQELTNSKVVLWNSFFSF
ncbi:MAG: hypothetical protein HW421_3073 [Ignavibacteria bacterium]|nr:hypothetical protein [Ignavibacteria bacterium]